MQENERNESEDDGQQGPGDLATQSRQTVGASTETATTGVAQSRIDVVKHKRIAPPWSYETAKDRLSFGRAGMAAIRSAWPGSHEPVRMATNVGDVGLIPGLNVVFGSQKSGKSLFIQRVYESARIPKTNVLLMEPIEWWHLSSPSYDGVQYAANIGEVYAIMREAYSYRAQKGKLKYPYLLCVDSLRSYLYTADGTLGSKGVSNKAVVDGLTQLHNAAATTGTFLVASINPVHSEDQGFVDNMIGAIDGSVRSIIRVSEAGTRFHQTLRHFDDIESSVNVNSLDALTPMPADGLAYDIVDLGNEEDYEDMM